jgi:conjugative relaxase-like TrwC/TraI family protein
MSPRVCGWAVAVLRVTTLHASAAAASAAYYARYLAEAPGEVPGVWWGRQTSAFGLAGTVTEEALETLLSGRDPASGSPLGRELLDRVKGNGTVVRAVAGFDATFSAPKSLSVWWALTGDDRLLEAHDAAVIATLEHLERFGATTRIRMDGRRLHPDTGGLTVAVFRQSTSRDDDPQVHTHAVISAKVQTVDGRWFALDARYLKRHQRMLGGLYQSMLRSELTARFGVGWEPIVNGQAEIAGVPRDLLGVFSKRSVEIDAALADKVAEFVGREGRTPSRFEHAALEREAARDTRRKKTGNGVTELGTRWRAEAEAVGWTAGLLMEAIETVGRELAERPVPKVTVDAVVEALSAKLSTWCRADVLRAICDHQRPVAGTPAERWLSMLERAADRVVELCVNLDPSGSTTRRASDGRSVWIEPTAPGLTSEAVLVEEEAIVAWAIEAQLADAAPSTSVDTDGLDVFQAEAAAAVAGWDELVLVVGPAGAGKTAMLARAREDLHRQVAPVFGLAPTAKAARVLERDTGIVADTVAKLLYEWSRPDRERDSRYRLPATTTVIVDEAGMIATADLCRLVTLARRNEWRLLLVGDPRQLQAVGRGGLFAELCHNGRVHQLDQIHRFTHAWEAEASLMLRAGDPRAVELYEAHGRIIPGSLDEHLDAIAAAWIDRHRNGDTVAMVASTNDHVDLLNAAVQNRRLVVGDLNPDTAVDIAGGEVAHVGEVVATRRNNRRLVTTAGEPVRNRELWTVTATHPDGAVTVSHNDGHGHTVLPADYARQHLRLGYAATEHGYESDTVTIGINLASEATTRRGLYVAVTRGRDDNRIHVITDSNDVTEARDVLERILAVDRADLPAITQRRQLAEQDHATPQPSRRREQPGRCEIPDWFNQLRDQTRHELEEAEQRRANHAERNRLESQLESARAVTDGLEGPTRWKRDRLAAAERDVDQASQARELAEQRLQGCGIRGRRHAHRDLAAAENQLTWANHTLAQIQASISPDVERYHHAWHQVRDLRETLRNHQTTEIFDRYTTTDRIAHLHQRLDALDTWWRFAQGDELDVPRLTEIIDTFGNADDHHGHYRWLTDAVKQHCHDAGIHLPTREFQTPRIETPGLEIGL